MSNLLLAKAISIVSRAFENKTDKGGHPYILHCIRVMEGVKHLGEKAMIPAILHDLVEDCEDDGYTFDFLKEQGFQQETLTILELLTHRKQTTSYDDYIKAISVHPVATAIKLSDIKDNTDITRLKGLRKKDFDRLEKYARAYTYLKNE